VIFNPAVGASSDRFIIAGLGGFSKLSVGDDGKTEAAPLAFFALDPNIAAVGANDGFTEIKP
jgi:hypothetical protein